VLRYDVPMTSENVPTPTSVKRVWWPAAVRLPGERKPRYNQKVYATDTGLYIYEQAVHPANARLVYFAPIDFDKTPEPPTNYSALRAGIQIHVTSGDVVSLNPQGGCGCQYKRLKRWRPDWAGTETAWKG
jgi:hypothetical protein